MPNCELATDGRNQIGQIRAMLHEINQRTILIVNRLPVGSMHFRVIKEFALQSPGLAKDLRPFRSRIHQSFHLADVDRSITDLYRYRPVYRDDTPSTTARARRLIQKFLLIFGKRIRSDAFEDGRRCSLLKLESLQSKGGSGSIGVHRLKIENCSRSGCREVSVIARRHPKSENALADSREVDFHGNRS